MNTEYYIIIVLFYLLSVAVNYRWLEFFENDNLPNNWLLVKIVILFCPLFNSLAFLYFIALSHKSHKKKFFRIKPIKPYLCKNNSTYQQKENKNDVSVKDSIVLLSLLLSAAIVIDVIEKNKKTHYNDEKTAL